MAAPQAASAGYRPDVQGLRAIAVLLVIVTHAGVTAMPGGFIGVDIFFVISGFVITGLLMRQPPGQVGRNLRTFYKRRVLRILPAATLTLTVTLIASYLLLGEYFDPKLIDDVRWAALFSANFRFIDTTANYFMSGIDPSLVTHFWSLAVEEQFYFGYPLLVFTLAGFGALAQRRVRLRWLLLIAIVISAGWSYYYTSVNPVAAYYSPFTRFWELALGGLVATLPVAINRKLIAFNNLLGIAALVAIGIAAWQITPTSVFPGVIAWWPCGATALLLWSGRANATSGPSRWLATAPMRYVGDISYSLYLWHFIWLMLPLQLEHPPAFPGAKLLEIAGAFGCAIASYHLLENPIRHSRRLSKDGWAVALLLLICIAITWDVSLLVQGQTASP